MNARIAALLFASSLLAACGGGGSGGSGAPPILAPTTTAAPTIAPSATPVPTAAPSAAPTPVPSAPASPASLTLAWTSAVLAAGVPPQAGAINLFAAGQTATLTATEPGYSGVFSISACQAVTNPPITISPINGSNSSFLITANNTAGTCKIVIGDASGQAASIQATVTLTGGTFQ